MREGVEQNRSPPASPLLSSLPQRSIDDKFRCLDECEGQVRRLQLALREKERDTERLRCILSNNEETITVRTRSRRAPRTLPH